MKVELDRKDLIALFMGQSPTYELMNNPIIASLGSYTGGFVDSWSWYGKSSFKNIRDEDILATYYLMKKSK